MVFISRLAAPSLILLAGFLLTSFPASFAFAFDEMCTPVSRETVQGMMDGAGKRLPELDWAGALQRLEEIELKLPCANYQVESTFIKDLHFLNGVVRYYLGSEALANASFKKAFAIDATIRWDGKYGARPRETFLDAREDFQGYRLLTIPAPALAKGVDVFLDGKKLEQNADIFIYPGTHFVQIRWPDGRWEGSFFELQPGREIPLPIPKSALLGDIMTVPPPIKPVEVIVPDASGEAKPSESTPPKSDSQSSGKRNGGFVAIPATITAIGAGGCIYFGLQYRSTKDELYNSGLYYSDVPSDEKEALLAENARAARRGKLSVGVTAISALATVGMIVRMPAPADTSTTKTSLLWYPFFSADGGGLALFGHF